MHAWINLATRRTRLNQLVTVVEEVEAVGAKIEMTYWLSEARVNHEGHVCGTVACIAGWAATSGVFQEQGLGWDDDLDRCYGWKGEGGRINEVKIRSIKFDGYLGHTAAKRFFHLTHGEERWLFSNDYYDTREPSYAAVIDRIKRLIDKEPLEGIPS